MKVRMKLSGGGGNTIDYSNPDVSTQYAIAKNSSQDFAVTQKPRFVFVYTRNSGGDYITYACIYDVVNDKGVLMSIGTGNVISVSSSISAIITAVTDSYVRILNNSSSYSRYTRVLAWY